MNFGTPEKRKLLKRHNRECDEVFEAWQAYEMLPCPPLPEAPHFPEDLHDMRCGAKTRKGTPCKQKAIYGNGRCKFHGGLSTGPRTAEGKARSARNWTKRTLPKR
ncbi:MAG: hypothetical protein H7X91_10165 [Burkholderiales bacterium]|nr:hypothetical protein [Burkholderiales bacterium]